MFLSIAATKHSVSQLDSLLTSYRAYRSPSGLRNMLVWIFISKLAKSVSEDAQVLAAMKVPKAFQGLVATGY